MRRNEPLNTGILMGGGGGLGAVATQIKFKHGLFLIQDFPGFVINFFCKIFFFMRSLEKHNIPKLTVRQQICLLEAVMSGPAKWRGSGAQAQTFFEKV